MAETSPARPKRPTAGREPGELAAAVLKTIVAAAKAPKVLWHCSLSGTGARHLTSSSVSTSTGSESAPYEALRGVREVPVRVVFSDPITICRTTAYGASRPLALVPAKVSF